MGEGSHGLLDKGRGLLIRVRSEFSFVRGDFLLILVGWLLTDFTAEMAYTYYPLFVQAIGGTASTVGLIASVGSIIQAFVKFPGGYIADQYSRKWIITYMTFGTAFAYLFFVFAPNWQTILFGVMIRSLCNILKGIATANIRKLARRKGFLPILSMSLPHGTVRIITDMDTTLNNRDRLIGLMARSSVM